MSLRLKLLIAGVLVALVAGTVVVAREVSSILRQVQAPQVSTEPTDSPGPPGLDRFYHQRLHWHACGAAQCTWFTVPVDYAHPGGKTLRLRANLIPASGSGGTRTLFVNPGGPGGSALQFAEAFAGLVGAKVRAMYDIVGVDPRGVGRSTPLKCLSDAQFDAFIDEDPTPDSPAEVRAYLRQSATLGQACRRNSGELADHVSTAEAARDMDVARALLGRSTLDWFGASYGTDLGATYATLFPERVGRMVLDGAVDPELDAFDASMAQAVGFSRALDAFIASCRGDKDCPLSRAAPIPELRRFLAGLDAKPMKVGDRQLSEARAFYALAQPLYNRGLWPWLEQALREAYRGDGTTLLSIADAYFDRDDNGHFADNSGQVIYAVSCMDSTDRPTETAVRAHLGEFRRASPIFGDFLGWGPLGCTDWPAKSMTPQPAINATGAPPILVLGTTRDPATPYESALALAKELRVGVMISRDGDGHTAYISGNPCITNTVDGFLVAGIVPASDPHC